VDLSVLESFSGAVDFEEDVRWLPLSASRSELEAAGVPAGWVELMSRPVSAVELVTELWRPVRAVLPRTVDRFTRVHDVAVLSTRQRGASLVYLFRSADGTLTLHRGFAPATALPPPSPDAFRSSCPRCTRSMTGSSTSTPTTVARCRAPSGGR
jgi:transposase